jgi:ABC-type nitrate/sulfonate/bicarbonate transport system permease component
MKRYTIQGILLGVVIGIAVGIVSGSKKVASRFQCSGFSQDSEFLKPET